MFIELPMSRQIFSSITATGGGLMRGDGTGLLATMETGDISLMTGSLTP
jgi:hypothetical protein